MDRYISQSNQSSLPSAYPIYYSKPRLLIGIVLSFLFIGLLLPVVTKAAQGGAIAAFLLWGAVVVGWVFALVNCARAFLKANIPALIIDMDGIYFNNGKYATWDDIKSNSYDTMSYYFISVIKTIVIKKHSARRAIRFPATALSLSSKEYSQACSTYAPMNRYK